MNKTTPYNPFDYLEGQDEIDAYLSEAFLDEDPRVFLVALGFLAKKKGMSEVAKRAGVNRESPIQIAVWRGKSRIRHHRQSDAGAEHQDGSRSSSWLMFTYHRNARYMIENFDRGGRWKSKSLM